MDHFLSLKAVHNLQDFVSAPQPSTSKVGWVLQGGEATVFSKAVLSHPQEPQLLYFPGCSLQLSGAGWQPWEASPAPLTWVAPSSRLLAVVVICHK